MTIRTLLFGAGRMAKYLHAVADEYPRIALVAQVSRTQPAEPEGGRPLAYYPTLDQARESLGGGIDLLIDFTLPQATPVAAQWCKAHRVAMLSGVTGLGEDANLALDEAAASVPVLWAANLSFGINVLASVLRDIGKLVDASAPVTIQETHHAGKKDAPSGTALMLARHLRPPVSDVMGSDSDRLLAEFPTIEFVSRREGEVVGDHSVMIDLGDETLTLSHHARSRALFARGALEAAMWLSNQAPGRYSAADWIRGRWTETKPFK